MFSTSPPGSHGSPNYVPRMLFDMLRRLRRRPDAPADGEEHVVQDALAAVFIGVNVVETFMNISFKLLAEQEPAPSWRDKLLADLAKTSFGLGAKMEQWPKLCFSKALDKEDPRHVAFSDLKGLRNGLMHFKTSHSTVSPVPGIVFQGLADLSLIKRLDAGTPATAMSAVVGFVQLLLEAQGLPPEKVELATLHWIGFG